MTRFLVQTVNGRVVHDFAFHLIHAIEQQNWFYNQALYEYRLSEEDAGEENGWIPVGSLEFVFAYMEKQYGIPLEAIEPINLPIPLQQEPFLKRKVELIPKKDMKWTGERFVKSQDRYKFFTDIVTNPAGVPEGNYMVSEVVEFESEWRAIVQQGELVGLQHYMGDFTNFPDISFLHALIQAYTNSPLAYTLDIGKTDKGWALVEVHPFVSCGLYGFADYKKLPILFVQGFHWFLQESRKKQTLLCQKGGTA